jgi:translocation and assembly module TamA
MSRQLAGWATAIALAGGPLLVAPPPAAAAQAAAARRVDRLEVELRVAGEEGGLLAALDPDASPLRDNIEALLAIAAARRDDDLTVSRLRQLHAAATAQIRRALEPFGHYRPTVRSELTRDAAGDDDWTARYEVEPGPRMEVADVEVRVIGAGADEPAVRAAADRFPLAPGDPLSHPAYESGKSSLSRAAAAAGYLEAEFQRAELRVDLDAYLASAVIVFDTGPRYLFGDVSFEQELLDPDLLLGYVTFEPGEPLEMAQLLTLQNALSESPYFRRVEVLTRPEEATGRRVPIVVQMEPAAAQRWDLGLGYGTDTGPRGTVELDLRRINRRGHRGEAELTVSEIEASAGVRYLVPGTYPRTDVTTFTLGFSELTPQTSRSRTALAGVGRTESRGRWREALGLTFRRTDFEVGVDRGVSELLVPEARWSLVQADDRIYPSRGQEIELGVSAAAEELLSESGFVQVTAKAKAVRSLGDSMRAIGRFEAGRTWASDFRRLPPEIRFFAGGDRSVRGYPFQGLGPLDAEGNVIGGEALLTASVEIDSLFLDLGRYGRWGAAVFYDVGGVGHEIGDRLVQGAGAGLRWLSPIGLVRADVAWALSQTGTPVRLHLMIGPDL